MSDINKLVGTARETFGKGVARKLRAAGKTPVVVYGHGTDPIHLSVETHPLSLIIRQANALIELDMDGAKQLVLVKDVQKDPVRQIIEHVDLVVVNQGETVEVEVAIHVVGEPVSGLNALQELNTLHVSALATNIPEFVVVNVDGLEEGVQIHANQVELPAGSTLLGDTDLLVVNIVAQRAASDDAAAAAE